MQYEITQIISYLVTAETPQEALEKWDNSQVRVTAIASGDGDVDLLDDRVEVNG